jgi:hypothetical protein
MVGKKIRLIIGDFLKTGLSDRPEQRETAATPKQQPPEPGDSHAAGKHGGPVEEWPIMTKI